MDTEKKHETLISEWKKSRPEYDYFATDGILSYSDYNNQEPKIMFLLKEPNADFIDISPIKPNSKGYGPKGNSNTFWRIMRGTEYTLTKAWNNENFNQNDVKKVIEKPNINTAYVNIKKQCENKSKSDNKEIISYARKDKIFLRQQIEYINPDIIYCGGTFSSYKILDEHCEKVNEQVYSSNGRFIIDFYHLAHRKGYKTFIELYNHISKIDFTEPK